MKSGQRQITPYTMTVLDCIESFYTQNGYPPTMREISALMGGSASTSAIRYAMDTLAQEGFLTVGVDGQSRTQVPTFKARYAGEFEEAYESD